MENKKKIIRKNLKKVRWLRIRYKIICLLGFSHKKWLKKHKIFGEFGDKILYQPDTLPNNPKLVKFHNNIMVATGVTFFEHDVINSVFVGMDGIPYRGHKTCIEIFDNVFIGGKSIIVRKCKDRTKCNNRCRKCYNKGCKRRNNSSW